MNCASLMKQGMTPCVLHEYQEVWNGCKFRTSRKGLGSPSADAAFACSYQHVGSCPKPKLLNVLAKKGFASLYMFDAWSRHLRMHWLSLAFGISQEHSDFCVVCRLIHFLEFFCIQSPAHLFAGCRDPSTAAIAIARHGVHKLTARRVSQCHRAMP